MAGEVSGSRFGAAVAALESTLDDLASADLDEVAVADLGALLVRVNDVGRRVQAQSARVVGRFDSQQGFASDGAANAAAWIRSRTRVTPAVAREQVRVARRLGELPTMAEAFTAGEIGAEHVSVVARAMHRSPARRGTIAAAEGTFAEAARRLDPADLAKVVTRWAHTVDPLGAVAAERELHGQRSLSVSRTFGGAVVINGLLAPEAGGLVLTALEAMSTADYRDSRDAASGAAGPDAAGLDERTPTQRRADALTELCRRFLDSGQAPQIAGVRPHLSVLVPLEALQVLQAQSGSQPGNAGGELEGIGPISAQAARRVGCDATVTGIGINPTGMPMSYGRTTRVVPAGLRKLIVARDRACRFPGCDRPPAWCEAHHLRFWADGGPTDAQNLALICVHHHHALHEGGFTTRGDPQAGTLTFHRPDGTRIVDGTARDRAGPDVA